MNQLSEREIRDLLTSKDVPAPPAGLAERIKSEIPEFLGALPRGDDCHLRRASPMRRYLVAAAVVTTLGGAVLVHRVRQEAPLDPSAGTGSVAVSDRVEAKNEADATTVGDSAAAVPEKIDRSEISKAKSEPRRQRLVTVREEPEVSASKEIVEPESEPPPRRRDEGRREAREESAVRRAPAAMQELETGARSATAKSSEEPPMGRLRAAQPRLEAAADQAPLLDAALAGDDAVSTFSFDADAASSYEVVRRFLREGRLPPPEAIRVAEILSHFDYGDPPPRRGDLAVHAEGTLSISGESARPHVLRFHLRTRDVEAGVEQPVVSGVRIQVSFNPEFVATHRLVGHVNRPVPTERDRDSSIDAGAIAGGDAITLLYEIVPRRPLARDAEIATLDLSYRSVIDDVFVETTRRVTGRDFSERWADASAALRLTSLVAELAERLAREEQPAHLDEIARRLQEVAAEFPNDADVAELVSLASHAARHRR